MSDRASGGPLAGARPARRAAVGAGLACLSAAVLLLEISLTRYFSFRLWYHYAFMIISIAMLGLTGASVVLAVARRRFEAIPFERFVARCSLLAGAAVIAALPGLALLNRGWIEAGSASVALSFLLVAGYWLLLVIPFGFAGAGIAWVIGRNAERAPALYALDLFGAALGCVAAVALLSRLLPERALGSAAVLLAIAAGLFVAGSGAQRWRTAPWVVALLLAAVGVTLGGDRLLGDRVTPEKALARVLEKGGEIVATRPSISGRVDVVNAPGFEFVWGLLDPGVLGLPRQLLVFIDGDALTTMTRWSGDEPPPQALRGMPASLPYALSRPENVLIIGPGGGMDVLNALEHGASRVVGVEINDGIIDLVSNRYSGFSGDLYRDPRVEIVHSDGRNFAQGTKEDFDLIQMTLVDSFAAISSGALTLSEDFLYTVEGFRAYLRALSPDGVLALGRTLHERLSLVAMLDRAARAEGFDLRRHLLVAHNPEDQHGLVVIVQRSPLTSAQVAAAEAFLPRANLRLDYAPGREEGAELEILALLEAPDRDGFVAEYSEKVRDIRPETDDRPFYFRSSKWSAVLGTYSPGRGSLLVILAVAVAFVVLFVLAPLFRVGRGALAGNGWNLSFFFLIGLGFMALEMGLLVRLGLFLGHPSRAITVALFGLLLSTGLGSALAKRWLRGIEEEGSAPAARRLTGLLAAVALLALVSGLAQPWVIDGAMGWPLAGRIAVATLLIAPLGLLLGAPMPLGLSALVRSEESLVLWAWGLNGAASVLGSIVTIVAAHALGFGFAFVLAAICYLAAGLCVRRGARA